MSSSEIVLADPIQPQGSTSIISRLMDRIRSWLSSGGAVSAMSGGMVNPAIWLGDPDSNMPQATEATVLGLPPFGRGVDLIASTIAGVTLRAYRYDRTQQIDVRIDPPPSILADPSPAQTPWEWAYGLVNDLLLYGNSFAFMGDPGSDGWPLWLEPIDATIVALGVNQDTGGLVWRVGDQLIPFGGLWHVSAGNRSGFLLGRSVISQYRDSLRGVLATSKHAGRYFTAGGMPSAILQSADPDLTQAQADQIKQKYRDTVGSGSREPMVLPALYTFTPVVSDAEKQQLVEARKWDAQLISMILGLKASQLGLDGPSMTYTNTEMEDIGFVRDTVDRWAKPIEHAVTKWLLPRGQTARFDWSGRMRFDSKTRAETLKTEKDAGFLTVDEGRQMLDRPPLPEQLEPPTPPGQAAPGQDNPNTTEPIPPTPEVAS